MCRSGLARWECYRCSYEVEGDNPPEECPNCRYSVTFWINNPVEKPMTLKDFVRKKILTLDGKDTALEAARLMRERDTENVLVTVDGVPTGMVTENDILTKVAAKDMPASSVPLSKIMTPLVTATSDTLVTEALKVMATRHIKRLVVTEGGRPIGIVSHRSILGGSFRAKGEADD